MKQPYFHIVYDVPFQTDCHAEFERNMPEEQLRQMFLAAHPHAVIRAITTGEMEMAEGPCPCEGTHCDG